jgi:hypothetical protein
MKKLTVTFSDDFYQKIQEFKKSYKINLSGEFRKCIERIIERKEAQEKPLPEDEKWQRIAERLRSEREEIMDRYENKGVNAAIMYLEEAHYGEIVSLVKWYQSNDGIPTGDENEGFSTHLCNYIDETPDFEMNEYHLNHYQSPIWKWLEGVKLGVNKFWDKVKDELQKV